MKLPFKTKKRKLQEECWSLDYTIVITVTDELLEGYDDWLISRPQSAERLKDEMYDILKLLHWSLWW